MTDLQLASFEEIHVELSKRFPLFAFVLIHPVDGQPDTLVTRHMWQSPNLPLLVGHIEILKCALISKQQEAAKPLSPDQLRGRLDPPNFTHGG